VIHVPKEQSGGVAIEIKGGEFSWNLKFDNEQEQQQQLLHQNTLSNINLQVKSGSCVAICGTVGSGKSSLLSCILGEIPKLAGTVKVSGTTAYVTQTAWIQSGKVEDNIRFGTPMDRVRYNAVLEACALKKDLELWAFGDQTEIGERGINMSGGQKQRIQLARALYQDSDVYLLDDPFSAVDAHTGSQLFRECILEMLASKTVIYVTHQVEFLPAADLILVLDKGQIVQAGKYDELLQAGTNFTALVEAHNEAIDSMDVSDNFGDDHGMEIMTDECFLDGVENHHVGDEVHKLQKQMHSRKSSFADLRKQTSKREKLELDLDDKNRQLIVEEAREKGDVSLNVYWSYITSIHKGLFTGLSVVAQSCFLLLQIGSNYWMAWASPTIDGDPGKMKNSTLILVYAGLAFGSSFFVAMRSIFVSLAGVFVAQKYFLDMIRCLFRAPMSFFDATPAGRILNRASADQSKLDLEVQYNLSGLAMAILQLLGILVVMSQVSLVVPLVFLPVAATCLWMEHYYMRSAREVARIMGVEKAPLLNHYGESIAGAPTIRAFGQDQQFMNTNIRLFDNYGRPCFFNFTLMEWLIFRMELLCNFVFSFAMVLVVLLPDNTISPSLTGLAVTYGLNLNIVLVGVIWNLCNLQTKIISVERIQQYTCIPSEAPLVIESRRPPPSWPSHGTIELQHLQIQYNQYSPLVLHGITCTFHGGKKVGVVGRTGSGKSTLIQALFRIVEPSGGRIVIDNLDISTIGLHDLRSKLSIIPQDPTLFEGTMRTNLDPLNEHTDIEVWEALDKCQLGDIMRSKDQKLDAPVGENGENWSAGQRQLVCLGRALLKHTRILVLDEATASVDSATDNLIQRTLRTEFSSCTVLTIAHRIPTVIDSDKVLVLSDGRVSEYDVPIRLLENKNSLFAKLVIEYSLRSTSCHS
jgi:ABC-type multidrug transport system fused ATPase/permease subunit